MSDRIAHTTEALLRVARDGDANAVDRIFPTVYDELRRLAGFVREGRSGETLSATALVHEAYLKLLRTESLVWEDRAHFLAIAARAMRQVLVDHAHARAAAKRGGGDPAHMTLGDGTPDPRTLSSDDVLDLDTAIAELARENPRAARVVECRYFGSMSEEETAVALQVSRPTVARDWRFARAWLSERLAG